MASSVLVIAITAFPVGGAAVVFVMPVTGIHSTDRRCGGPVGRSAPLDAVTRSILRTSAWPGNPAVHGDCEQR